MEQRVNDQRVKDQRVKITTLDTARLTCPECSQTRILQLSEYKLSKRFNRVKYTCNCGHTYMAILEKRSGREKTISLAGTFSTTGKEQLTGRMVIIRLNSDGLTLRTNTDEKLLPGITLKVEFVLDDPKQSVVTKDVRIQAKKGRYLTAEFIKKEHFDNLGPYLFFNKLYV